MDLLLKEEIIFLFCLPSTVYITKEESEKTFVVTTMTKKKPAFMLAGKLSSLISITNY